MTELLKKLETHSMLGAASPGFHLTEDDISEVIGALRLTPKRTSYLEAALTPRPWKVQSFEYYAAHFLVGTGLTGGDIDNHVRGLADTMKKQYDIGVEHGQQGVEGTRGARAHQQKARGNPKDAV